MALLQDDPQHTTPAVGTPDLVTDAPSAEPAPSEETLARARELLAAHPVADGHNGLARAIRSAPWSDIELGESTLDTDIPRLRAGGVGAQFWSLHPGPSDTGCAVSGVLEHIDYVRAMVGAYPEALRLALSSGEVGDARCCGRIASLLGPAEAPAIGSSLGTLRALHALGVRALTLTGTDWAPPTGLTRFGQEVVREMNRVGMVVDLSGTTPETMRAALTVSRAPVVLTRSGAHALTPHPANVPDDVLSALRENGGLCMVPFDAARTGSSVRDVADHLDHVRSLAGPGCVGLSGTYDTGAARPGALRDAGSYPYLIAELLDRGWPEADLARLTWENLQQVLRDAEFTAKAAQERRGPSTARIEELDA
ncbi:dipeptidase [Streptomyces spiroverticillatus]|uniref:Dipeptidase n=1 Tax=Streptomyces finlayi TaxID=67296 RepID=A0A918X7X7_9ACTN|nr:dipeptidase [Streptomyces finlayi]GHA41189.1 dipeptidase [Streptomyces spiroverticillatus]GHD16812.1 dipeptidase [Streptomyces finlayi]